MIKYRLINLGRQLLFQVLEMDENQRHTGCNGYKFTATGKVNICSVMSPYLSHGTELTTVSLRGGDKTKDLIACLYPANDTCMGAGYIIELEKKIHNAIAEWVKAGGFAEARKKELQQAKEISPGIWEL